MKANGTEPSVAFPYVVQRRNGRATIYRREKTKGGRTYVEFRLATFEADGKLKLTSFADFNEAVKAAEARLAALGRGLVEVTTLSGPDRLDYLSAREMLPASVSLTDASRAWLKANEAAKVVPIAVPDAVAAFVTSRGTSTVRGNPASEAYLRDIEKRLAKLSEAFPADTLDAITAKRLEAWADALGIVGRNRTNTLRIIRTLLRWAQKRGHVTEGKLATDSLEMRHGEGGAIEIFTPAELRKFLAVARPVILPYLTLAAFGGLRTAEIRRLDWADLKLERGFIEVAAHKAKTRSRRLVPVLPALAAWLTPIRAQSGPLLPFSDIGRQTSILARDAGVEWRQNALRHSFVSYRLASIQNVDKVALEAGNSPQMVFRNYRELVTLQEAEEWFSVMPTKPWNVVPMGSTTPTPNAGASTA